jgi:hypothetical protein
MRVPIGYVLNCNLLINCCVDDPNIHIDIYIYIQNRTPKPENKKLSVMLSEWKKIAACFSENL